MYQSWFIPSPYLFLLPLLPTPSGVIENSQYSRRSMTTPTPIPPFLSDSLSPLSIYRPLHPSSLSGASWREKQGGCRSPLCGKSGEGASSTRPPPLSRGCLRVAGVGCVYPSFRLARDEVGWCECAHILHKGAALLDVWRVRVCVFVFAPARHTPSLRASYNSHIERVCVRVTYLSLIIFLDGALGVCVCQQRRISTPLLLSAAPPPLSPL